MAKVLTDSQLDLYRKNGFHFPVPILDGQQAKRHYRRYLAEASSIDGAGKENPHLRENWLDEIVRHPLLLDVVEDLLGPDILCLGARFFSKSPGGPSYVSWHQDATYCGLSRPDMVTVWVAFTRADPVSGAVRMIPGSHREQARHRDTFARENMLTRGQELVANIDETEAIDVILEPGHASFHHPFVFHGSLPNRSSADRVGFGIQYIRTDVSPLQDFKGAPVLVRGIDRYEHFVHPPAVQ
jgi:non-heme Fe2+,alpha-ketoglutarate-dependent halogenase